MEFPFPVTLPFAHRGAHDSTHPENSLAAVERVAQLGAPAIELDVCNLRDGTLIVNHDRIVRVEGKRLDLTTVSSSEVGDRYSRVETLLEVIARSRMLLNFDWKGSGFEYRIGDLLSGYGLVGRTIVSVGSLRKSDEVKREHTEVRTGLSIGRWEKPDPRGEMAPFVANALRSHRCDAVMLNKRLVSREVVSSIRECGGGLFVWTVQSRAEFNTLLPYKPDGIMTNAIAEHTASPGP